MIYKSTVDSCLTVEYTGEHFAGARHNWGLSWTHRGATPVLLLGNLLYLFLEISRQWKVAARQLCRVAAQIIHANHNLAAAAVHIAFD